MAYMRWGSKSDWYVFWESSAAQTKYDERLAIWHADQRSHQFIALYSEVRAMLDAGDFRAIPGFAEHYRASITEALAAFVEDVDREHGSPLCQRSCRLSRAA